MTLVRRLLRLILPAVLLLSCIGCSNRITQKDGWTFYYLAGTEEYGAGETLLRTEYRELPEKLNWTRRIQTYISGPVDETLKNPFPQNLRVLDATQRDATLELTLSKEYDTLTGVEQTMANACMVWTLTESEGVEQVMLRSESGADLMNGAGTLNRGNYLVEEDSAEKEYVIRVYFADAENRYLIPALHQIVTTDDGSLGQFALYQLLEGPEPDSGLYSTIPKGTRLLGFSVENGVATVDLSEEFVKNQPVTELGERMTLLSIVNTLTEQEGIESVQIQVKGDNLEYYRYMLMNSPLERDESAIGPARTGTDELDATLYYRTWSNEHLAAAPTRIIRDGTRSLGELILQALFESQPVNGLSSAIPSGTRILSVETIEGVCYVDLSAEFANLSGSYSEQRQAVHAVVASLCSVNSINAVQITVEGGKIDIPAIDQYTQYAPLAPMNGWFFP